MTFSYNRSYFEQGFPVNVNSRANNTYTISGIPSGKDHEYIFTIKDNGDIFAVGADGKGLFYEDLRQGT